MDYMNKPFKYNSYFSYQPYFNSVFSTDTLSKIKDRAYFINLAYRKTK